MQLNRLQWDENQPPQPLQPLPPLPSLKVTTYLVEQAAALPSTTSPLWVEQILEMHRKAADGGETQEKSPGFFKKLHNWKLIFVGEFWWRLEVPNKVLHSRWIVMCTLIYLNYCWNSYEIPRTRVSHDVYVRCSGDSATRFYQTACIWNCRCNLAIYICTSPSSLRRTRVKCQGTYN